MKKNTTRPVAYSYVRFSTRKQELGDSLRRQVQAAETYAREKNLELSARSFRDLGVSGFKQRNVKSGALAAFIGAVKSGLIVPGSYLLIEQFDRLSRAQVTIAFRLLLDLVDLGITVVTLVDEKVWNSETVDDVTNVLTSVILMGRAHEESKSKAKRLREVWGEKKKAAQSRPTGERRIVTGECPRWLKPKPDKTGFEVIEDLAESVRKVFDARVGGFGVSSIVTMANREGWPVPGKRPVRTESEDEADFVARRRKGATWHTSLVGRLLKNRAVIGEYQPHVTEYVRVKDEADKKVRVPVGDPVPDYYPAILDEGLFLRALAVTDRRGRFPGRRDASLKNWLQGLLRCGACGQSMVRKNKDSKAQPAYARYYCTARTRGVSKCPGANAGEIEGAVITVVSVVAPPFLDGSTRRVELKAAADALQVTLSEALSARDRYVEAIGSSKDPMDVLLVKLSETEARVKQTRAQLGETLALLADASTDTDAVFESIASAVQSLNSLKARAELREDLARVIEKIEVHEASGFIRVHLRAGDIPIVQPMRVDALLPGLVPMQAQAAGHLKGRPRRRGA